MGQAPKAAYFAAYPGSVSVVRDCFRAASEKLRVNGIEFHTWEQNDICGVPLTDPIFDHIEHATAVIADITDLNFNVTFEIGFSIARQKRVFLVRNEGFWSNPTEFERVGIFDTLGYEKYENSDQLRDLVLDFSDFSPLSTFYPSDSSAPIYIVELPRQTEFMRKLISRVKKSHLRYRSFNPVEHIRLSAREAIEHVSKSFGVLVPLASSTMPDAKIHNMRAAFVAGLSYGLNKPTLLIQEFGGPVPLDVRDIAKSVKHPGEIDDHIHDLALRTVDGMQEREAAATPVVGFLSQLSIGDPMAENEFTTLADYYLETDEFQRTRRGEVNLVVGRKGTGKTALFAQVRDATRKNRSNVVCDLKPEGYQLIRLREEILDQLSEGSREFLITAFWEYLLYLEIVYKILEKDRDRHLRDHTITDKYRGLQNLYDVDGELLKGDFSERLLRLSDHLVQDFRARGKTSGKLSAEEMTKLLYKHDLKGLREHLVDYLRSKGEIWILFDNLDKGWSPEGLREIDISILRCLIDAGRKIQREFRRQEIYMVSVVFVRNDVYELLMKRSPDFGKEIRVSLDWSDVDLLRELLRRRLAAGIGDRDAQFEGIWNRVIVPIHKGENSFHYLVDRCLMRPRNLLKELMHCKAAAVNIGHDRIEGFDIEKGLLAYSHDVLIEADRELSDIDSSLANFLYQFIGDSGEVDTLGLWGRLEEHGVASSRWEAAVDFLLYFGFFGVRIGDSEPKYIYSYNYNSALMKAEIVKNQDIVRFCINPAFWPALSIRAGE